MILLLDDIEAFVVEKILKEYCEEHPENRNSNIAYYVSNKIKELLIEKEED